MPHPHIALSLTRHREATLAEVWAEGFRIATLRQKMLCGHAMLPASCFRMAALDVVPKPIVENPNHCDVTGWPPEKSDQKMAALEIAKQAKLELAPSSNH